MFKIIVNIKILYLLYKNIKKTFIKYLAILLKGVLLYIIMNVVVSI